MALGSTNISTGAVNTELGSPYTTPRLVSQLCSHANAGNIASLYGPGTLAVDASKNVYWVTPTSNYKLGDFRLYNRTASAPSAAPNFTHNWGPGGSSTNISIATQPQQMNLFFIDSAATRIYYKAYLSSANRAAETSPWDTQLSSVLTTSISPPSSHTRAGTTTKPQHPHVQTFNNFLTLGLSSPTDYIYLDTFFASVGGTRLVNLGNAISNGYTTITMHELQPPQIVTSGLAPTPWPVSPTYTAIIPVIHTASTPCASSSPMSGGSIGTTNISFYFGFHGFTGSATHSLGATSVTIQIAYNGSTKSVSLGTVSHSAKTSVSTTLPGGNSWAYDKNAVITCTAATFSIFPSYTTC